MVDIKLKITFITPCFSHGATDTPEIRPASIRGMLHHWFRLLGGTFKQEQEVFGGIAGKAGASKVVVRVKEIQGLIKDSFSTIPQAKKTQSFNRPAYEPRTSFRLQITERLGGLKENRELFKKAIHAWLLMGTLGYRSTRAAGSFLWEAETGDFPYPKTREEYKKACKELSCQNFKVALLEKRFPTAEEARKVVSHTLKEGKDHAVNQKLRELNHPLGCVGDQRKTSPLKFRIVQLQKDYHILAVWDARKEVTGNSDKDLEGIMDLLDENGREIGTLLLDRNL